MAAAASKNYYFVLILAKLGNDNVAHGWAFQKAYHLIGEISKKGELPELLDELDVLSRKYAITTIYSP